MFPRQTKRKSKIRLEMLLKTKHNKTTRLNLITVIRNVVICLMWPNMRHNKVITMRLRML